MTYWTDDKAAELHGLIVRALARGFKATPDLTFARADESVGTWDHWRLGDYGIEVWHAAAILEAELREFWLRDKEVGSVTVSTTHAEVNGRFYTIIASGPTPIHAIVAALEASK